MEIFKSSSASKKYGGTYASYDLPSIWDIEAQPSQVITPKGEVVRDADKAITSSRCYSIW